MRRLLGLFLERFLVGLFETESAFVANCCVGVIKNADLRLTNRHIRVLGICKLQVNHKNCGFAASGLSHPKNLRNEPKNLHISDRNPPIYWGNPQILKFKLKEVSNRIFFK
jgi:hypothetical protein